MLVYGGVGLFICVKTNKEIQKRVKDKIANIKPEFKACIKQIKIIIRS
jgi:hypothetical protein